MSSNVFGLPKPDYQTNNNTIRIPNDGYEYLGVVELGNGMEFYIIIQSLAVFPRSKSITQDIRSRFS